MVTNEQIQAVIHQIYANFENTSYPGDNYIGVHRIDEGFKGKIWKDISIPLLLSHRDDLGSLTPEAFCYYLPAFLLAVLQSAAVLDSFPENFLEYLIPPKSVSYDRRNKQFIALNALNAQQKTAVAICLKIVGEVYADVEWSDFQIYLAQAIKFWSQYLP